MYKMANSFYMKIEILGLWEQIFSFWENLTESRGAFSGMFSLVYSSRYGLNAHHYSVLWKCCYFLEGVSIEDQHENPLFKVQEASPHLVSMGPESRGMSCRRQQKKTYSCRESCTTRVLHTAPNPTSYPSSGESLLLVHQVNSLLS